MSPTREQIYRRRRIAAVIAGAVALLLIIIALGLFGTQPATTIQGDQLGPDNDESATAYQARAEEALAAAEDPTYALVAFDEPQSAEAAAASVEDAQRMSAIIIGNSAHIAVPEPIDGETRVDVINTVFERAGEALSGIGDIPAPDTVSAVVIWDDPDTLRAIAEKPHVTTVEPAPADAAWGSFSVRVPH